MASIRLIKQIDDTGCGIACVSMIANRNYKSVKSLLKELMDERGWKKTNRTRAKQLHSLLNVLGIKSMLKKSKAGDEIKGVSIVGVNRDDDGFFHWVIAIKDSKRFLIIDPEYGEVFQGDEWADKENGYIHSTRKSGYISVPMAINSIKI